MGVVSSPERIAGAALLLAIMSIVVGLAVVGMQGTLRRPSAGFRGIEGIGEKASALSVMGPSRSSTNLCTRGSTKSSRSPISPVAMAGLGWAVLRTDLLESWVGWFSIGWSALWVVGYFLGLA